MDPVSLRVTRRQVAAGLGASMAVLAAASSRAQQTAEYVDGWRILRAKAGQARLRGAEAGPTAISGYDGVTPGPTLRIRRGEELRVRLVNELADPHHRTLAWAAAAERHGRRPAADPAAGRAGCQLRLPLRAAPDAGTFWYHAHFMSSEQVGRGLYGPLIVDETTPLAIDRDITLMLDDWRLTTRRRHRAIRRHARCRACGKTRQSPHHQQRAVHRHFREDQSSASDCGSSMPQTHV